MCRFCSSIFRHWSSWIKPRWSIQTHAHTHTHSGCLRGLPLSCCWGRLRSVSVRHLSLCTTPWPSHSKPDNGRRSPPGSNQKGETRFEGLRHRLCSEIQSHKRSKQHHLVFWNWSTWGVSAVFCGRCVGSIGAETDHPLDRCKRRNWSHQRSRQAFHQSQQQVPLALWDGEHTAVIWETKQH